MITLTRCDGVQVMVWVKHIVTLHEVKGSDAHSVITLSNGEELTVKESIREILTTHRSKRWE